MNDEEHLQEAMKAVQRAFDEVQEIRVYDFPIITITTQFSEKFPDVVEFTSKEVPGVIIAWNRDNKQMGMWSSGSSFVLIDGTYITYAAAKTQARRELESIAKVL